MSLSTADLATRLAFAKDLAVDAGVLAQKMLLAHAEDQEFVANKGPQDFVTAADKAVETLISERIAARYPEDGFLGEESGARAAEKGIGQWVVDPIDGTANYMRGLPHWAVSIAYVLNDVIELGVIHAPALQYSAYAQRGAGAFDGERRIGVSRKDDMAVSLFIVGSARKAPFADYISIISRLYAEGAEHRRLGSAAIGLLEVAYGHCEGYVEAQVNPWDVFAGHVIVTEAGGSVRMPPVGEYLLRGGPICATNSLVQLDGIV